MGVDFIRARAKSFTKAWDAGRLELARKTLFTRESESLVTGAVATTTGPHALRLGDEILVRVDGERVELVDDLTVKGVLVKPTAAIIEKIRQTGGYATASVDRYDATNRLAEVTIR